MKVVTCGNVPLESSFQKAPRCVYTSTSLYEYRGWDSKAANPTHRRFTWGLRSLEVSPKILTSNIGINNCLILDILKSNLVLELLNFTPLIEPSFYVVLQSHVVDFYISDFQSGLRALVKTGYGARVTPYVDDSFVVDVNAENKELSPEFIRWLGERNLSSDDRMMRLKEG